MSHRDSCPDSWEARREGESAHRNYQGSWDNPYRDTLGNDHACPEAERSWEEGRRNAERQEEESLREEHEYKMARERAAENRREEEQEYPPEQEATS